jgi:hypothetical protein
LRVCRPIFVARVKMPPGVMPKAIPKPVTARRRRRLRPRLPYANGSPSLPFPWTANPNNSGKRSKPNSGPLRHVLVWRWTMQTFCRILPTFTASVR